MRARARVCVLVGGEVRRRGARARGTMNIVGKE